MAQAPRLWIRRHPIRFAIYLVLGALLITAVIGVMDVLLRGDRGLAAWLLNRPAVRNLARGAGLDYDVSGIRVGSSRLPCPFETEVDNVTLRLEEGNGVIQLASLRICPGRFIETGQLSFQTGTGIQIGGARTDWPFRDLTVRGAALMDPGGQTLARADLIEATGVVMYGADQPGRIGRIEVQSAAVPSRAPGGPPTALLREVAVEDVRLPAEDGGTVAIRRVSGRGLELDPAGLLERRAEALSIGPLLVQPVRVIQTALERVLRSLSDLQDRTRFVPLIAAALLLVLHALLSPAPLAARWLTALAGIAVPAALFLLLWQILPLPWLLAAGIGGGILLAVLLWRIYYHHAPEWHQTAEPVGLLLLAPLVLIPLLAAWHIPVAAPPVAIPGAVSTGELELAGISGGFRPAACPGTAIFSLEDGTMRASDIAVLLEGTTGEFASFSADASFHGAARNAFVEEPATICADLRIRNAPVEPPAIPECDTDGAHPTVIAAGAGLAINRALEGEYEARSRIQSGAWDIRASAFGGEESARIADVRTVGSPVRIGAGSGSVRWVPAVSSALNLSGLEWSAGRNRAAAQRLNVRGGLDSVCQSAPATVRAQFTNVSAAQADRFTLAASGLDVDLRRAARRQGTMLIIDGRLDGAALRGGLTGESAGPWLDASLAGTSWRLEGVTGSEWLPRRLEGSLLLRTRDAAGGAPFALPQPLLFQADLRTGRFTVPEQPFVLEQAALPGAPATVSGRFQMQGEIPVGAAGGPFRLQGNLSIPENRFQDGALDLAVRQFQGRFALSVRGDEPEYQAVLEAPDNRLHLPSFPAEWRIGAIGPGAFQTSGSLTNFRLNPPTEIPELTNVLRLPASPEELRFGWRAAFASRANPDLRVEFQGRVFRTGEIRYQPHSLRITDGAFEAAEGTLEIGPVQNQAGEGQIRLASTFSTRPGETVAEGTLHAGTAALTQFRTQIAGDKLAFELRAPLSSSQATDSLRPYFPPPWPDSLRLTANVGSLRAAAQLSAGRLNSLELTGDLMPGPWAEGNLREMLPSLNVPFAEFAVRGMGDAPHQFALQLGESQAESRFQSPGVELTANDPQGGSLETRWDGSLQLGADTSTGGRPRDVLDRLGAMAAALGHHARKAIDFSGNPGPADATWKAALRSPNGSTPFLFFGDDRIRFGAAAGQTEVSIRQAGAASGWHFAGSVDSAGLLAGFQDHLMLDTATAIEGRLQPPATSTFPLSFREPFLLAFAPTLRSAPESGRLLWDSGYYQKLESSFPREFSSATPGEPLFSINNFHAGPLVLSDIAVTALPPFAAIGFGDALQLYASPFQGKLLYGDTSGEAHAQWRWNGRSGLLDAAAALTASRIQLGGVQLSGRGSPVALLQHQVDGSLVMALRGIPVRSFQPARLLNDLGLPGVLGASDLSVNLYTSEQKEGIPPRGVLQATYITQFESVNDLLRTIARHFRVASPPRTVTFERMRLSLDARQGSIANTGPFLTLTDLGLMRSDIFSLRGDVQLFLERPQAGHPPATLESLVGFLERFRRAAGPELTGWPTAPALPVSLPALGNAKRHE